ncbi:DUF927 domain-containing protein, partial [Pectobacterium versatile]|uniref:DUF927 domain-containing protein n=1 Tax=Pectobacterium versatile TaxID=2488639 RepID=UPI001F28FF22
MKVKKTKDFQGIGVKLIAISRMNEKNNSACRLVSIYSENTNGCIESVIPNVALANKNEVMKIVLKAGYPPSLLANNKELIYEEVIKSVSVYFMLCNSPGFNCGVYLRADDRIVGEIKGDKPVLNPFAKNHFPKEVKQRTLKEWKEQVASLAGYSSRLMLAVCCGFTGPLLKIVNMEGGGFHLWGTSSMGKSSSAEMMASIAGRPSDIVTLWSNTDKGLEEIAVAHNDSTLILDESKLLDKDPVSAARIMQNRVYTLSGGKGKLRSALYENNVPEWRVGVFSTGELSLAQHAEAGNIERLNGENVRVIDVPADAGCGLGIFERLPAGSNSGNELANDIKRVTRCYYGSAKPRFLAKLVADLQSDPEELKALIESEMDYFIEKHGVDMNSGIDMRIASRFALAYAAGFIASKYKVFPFRPRVILEAISKCYLDSVANQCNPLLKITEMLPNALMKVMASDELLDLSKSSAEDARNEMAIIHFIKKTQVIAVKKNFVHNLISLQARKNIFPKMTSGGLETVIKI